METTELRVRVAVEVDLVPDPGSRKPADRRPVVFRRRSRAEVREDWAALREAYDLLPADGLGITGMIDAEIVTDRPYSRCPAAYAPEGNPDAARRCVVYAGHANAHNDGDGLEWVDDPEAEEADVWGTAITAWQARRKPSCPSTFTTGGRRYCCTLAPDAAVHAVRHESWAAGAISPLASWTDTLADGAGCPAHRGEALPCGQCDAVIAASVAADRARYAADTAAGEAAAVPELPALAGAPLAGGSPLLESIRTGTPLPVDDDDIDDDEPRCARNACRHSKYAHHCLMGGGVLADSSCSVLGCPCSAYADPGIWQPDPAGDGGESEPAGPQALVFGRPARPADDGELPPAGGAPLTAQHLTAVTR